MIVSTYPEYYSTMEISLQIITLKLLEHLQPNDSVSMWASCSLPCAMGFFFWVLYAYETQRCDTMLSNKRCVVSRAGEKKGPLQQIAIRLAGWQTLGLGE